MHVVRGRINVNGTALEGGDALKISAEAAIHLTLAEAAEVLVFDLPY